MSLDTDYILFCAETAYNRSILESFMSCTFEDSIVLESSNDNNLSFIDRIKKWVKKVVDKVIDFVKRVWSRFKGMFVIKKDRMNTEKHEYDYSKFLEILDDIHPENADSIINEFEDLNSKLKGNIESYINTVMSIDGDNISGAQDEEILRIISDTRSSYDGIHDLKKILSGQDGQFIFDYDISCNIISHSCNGKIFSKYILDEYSTERLAMLIDNHAGSGLTIRNRFLKSKVLKECNRIKSTASRSEMYKTEIHELEKFRKDAEDKLDKLDHSFHYESTTSKRNFNRVMSDIRELVISFTEFDINFFQIYIKIFFKYISIANYIENEVKLGKW